MQHGNDQVLTRACNELTHACNQLTHACNQRILQAALLQRAITTVFFLEENLCEHFGDFRCNCILSILDLILLESTFISLFISIFRT